MTSEENRLAALLERLTPEPARPVSVDDVRARLGEPRRTPAKGAAIRRGWLPALAAVSVLLVVSLVIAITSTLHDADPAHPSVPAGTGVSSQPPTTSTTTSTTTEPPTLLGQSVGPWNAVIVNERSLFQLLGAGDSLFAVSDGAIIRMGPDGRVVAQSPYRDLPGPWLVSGGTVTMTPSDPTGDTVRLDRFDSTTLAPQPPVVLAFPSLDTAGRLLAPVYTSSRDHATLYVGAGREVDVVDAATGHLVRQIAIPAGQISSLAPNDAGTVLYVGIDHSVYRVDPSTGVILGEIGVSSQRDTTAIAVSPDGTTMYAATVSHGYVEAEVQVIDLASGSTRATFLSGNGVSSIRSGFVATDEGVFIRAGTGMLDQITFVSEADINHGAFVATGGGGLEPTLTLTSDVAWLGGFDVGCADPVTGRVLASGHVPKGDGGPGAIYGFATAGGHLFASYDGGRVHALVRLTPPAACLP